MNGLIVRLLFVLLVWISLSGCRSPESVEVEFPVRVPDPNKVKEVRDQEKSEISGYEPAELEKHILDAFTRFNRMTVAPTRSWIELEQEIRNIRIATNICLEEGGQKRLRKLILWLLLRFEKNLKDLIAVSNTSGAIPGLLFGTTPPEEIEKPHTKFVELGGDFIPNAYNASLLRLSKKGGIELVEGGEFFARLAFKVRWAKILPEVTHPLSWLLVGYEREWYDIWTLERSKTASLSRKLEAILRLKKRNPAYRDHTARGIVYYQHQDYRRSAGCFEQALKEHSQDKRVQSYLKAAKRHLR